MIRLPASLAATALVLAACADTPSEVPTDAPTTGFPRAPAPPVATLAWSKLTDAAALGRQGVAVVPVAPGEPPLLILTTSRGTNLLMGVRPDLGTHGATVVWSTPGFDLGDGGAVRVGDLGGDGHPDVVAADAQGVRAFAGLTGVSRFQVPSLSPLVPGKMVLGDVDGVPGDEILVDRGDEVAVIDGDGHVLRTVPDGGGSPVAVLALDGLPVWLDSEHGRLRDPATGAVVGHLPGRPFVLGATTAQLDADPARELVTRIGGLLVAWDDDLRTVRWTTRALGGGAPVVGDLDDDGKDEVLSGFVRDGGMAAWVVGPDGRMRRPLPSRDLGQVEVPMPAIADFDGDGHDDVVFTYQAGWGAVIDVRAGDGAEVWSGPSSPSAQRITDLDGDGTPEAAFRELGDLVAYRPDGSVLATGPLAGTWYAPIRTGDLDADGDDEILEVASRGTHAQELSASDVLGSALAARWRTTLVTDKVLALDVGDVDGDGGAEVVVVTQDAAAAPTVQALAADGGPSGLATVRAGTAYYPFAIRVVDLDDDGRAEVLGWIYGPGTVDLVLIDLVAGTITPLAVPTGVAVTGAPVRLVTTTGRLFTWAAGTLTETAAVMTSGSWSQLRGETRGRLAGLDCTSIPCTARVWDPVTGEVTVEFPGAVDAPYLVGEGTVLLRSERSVDVYRY